MTTIGELLRIDNLSINGSFGLEYYFQSNFEKAECLLKDGIRFCEMIEEGNRIVNNGDVLNASQLDDYEAFQVLIKITTPEKLKDIVRESEVIKKNLLEMINSKSQYPEDDIRKMQHFFNVTGKYYLGIAMRRMRYR